MIDYYSNRSVNAAGPAQPLPSFIKGPKSSMSSLKTGKSMQSMNWLNQHRTKTKELQYPDVYQDANQSLPEFKNQYSGMELDLNEHDQRLIITYESWRGINLNRPPTQAQSALHT